MQDDATEISTLLSLLTHQMSLIGMTTFWQNIILFHKVIQSLRKNSLFSKPTRTLQKINRKLLCNIQCRLNEWNSGYWMARFPNNKKYTSYSIYPSLLYNFVIFQRIPNICKQQKIKYLSCIYFNNILEISLRRKMLFKSYVFAY